MGHDPALALAREILSSDTMLVPLISFPQSYIADASNWDSIASKLKGLCVAGPAILRIEAAWWSNSQLTSHDEKASRSKQKPKWMMKLARAGELMLDGLPASEYALILTALDAGFLRVVVDVQSLEELELVGSVVKASN